METTMAVRVHFACPSCENLLGSSLEYAGRCCRCPRCGNELTVPGHGFDQRPLVGGFDDDSLPATVSMHEESTVTA
jgi:hypothetical protein